MRLLEPFIACLGLAAGAPSVAADLHAVVRDTAGRAVAEAVVVAVPDQPLAKPPPARPEQVEQIGEEFVPRVKAVQVGSSVSFPNRDHVRHHVYSFSPAKRFDVPLYVGTPAKPVVFDAPGVVTIGCNIHDWMVGYVYVSESPYFAVTGKDGKAMIAGLAPGGYSLRVWHPQLAAAEASTVRRATLKAAEILEWQIALKPEVRIMRAPRPAQGGRY